MNLHHLKYQSASLNRPKPDRVKRIINLAFFFHFFFYAITPLSYTFINNSLDQEFVENSGRDTKNFHLYVLDVMVSYISPRLAGDANHSASDFVLLRKKRAVLSESNLDKLLVLSCSAALENDQLLITRPVYVTFSLFWDKEHYPSEIFRHYSSGLSPPPC